MSAARRALAALAAVALCGALAPAAAAQALDWDVPESPAGPRVTVLRAARDGALGLFTDASDLQLAVFGDAALLGAAVLMGCSDGLGLLDDNPLTQHVFKAVGSQSLARTAYLLHLAGAEALLGSHGLERERYLREALTALNPLLDPDEAAARLPLDPLAFVGEGMLHGEVYRGQRPGRAALAALLADVALRPAGNLLRMVGDRVDADRIEAAALRMVHRTLE